MELLLGCGNDRRKKLTFEHIPTEWTQLVTLDISAEAKPDVVHDLNVMPLPFEDSQFDEIHAYEVLEHVGWQGDWRFFFRQFDEFWRILKPGGYLCATVPMWDSPWAWGDPGHTRVLPPECLIFLDRRQYVHVGNTAMTDYRAEIKCDFEPLAKVEEGDMFGFVLRAIKGGAKYMSEVA